MNLYHIKLTDDQKSALEHLFSLDIAWNKTELEKAWHELRAQVREAAQNVAIINALQDSGCNCNRKTPTKYDPCRKFKKGDKVRVVERHGRYQPNIPCDELWKGLCTVAEDEDFCNNLVKVRSEDGREKLSHWWYLEIVTPVEELEYFYIKHDTTGFAIVDRLNMCYVAHFKAVQHPHAKEAAEAERDRLNAEYRKEQNNG